MHAAALPLFELDAPAATTAAVEPKHNHRIPDRVMKVLGDILWPAKGPLNLDLPPLEATLYQNVAIVLNACGVVWDRKQKTHIVSDAALATLRSALASGSYYDSVRALEFYATSPNMARSLARVLEEHIGSRENPRILEPSAGEGALIEAALEIMPHANITAVELDPVRFAHLQRKYANDERVEVLNMDTTEYSETGFDAVLMNAPFEWSAEHVKHAWKRINDIGWVVGIAMTTRRKDRETAVFLQERDAIVWPTDEDAFVGTTVGASCFEFHAGPSYLDRLKQILAEEHPSIGAPAIKTLCDVSRDLHRLHEDACQDRNLKDYDERHAAAVQRARSLVEHEGIKVIPVSDPRAGHGFVLGLPSGRTNDFGRRGILVPKAAPEPKW